MADKKPIIRIKAKLKVNAKRVATTSREKVFGIPLYETNLVESDPLKAGAILKEHGCVVVPCFKGDELIKVHQMTRTDISQYPEYRNTKGNAAKARLETHGDGLDYSIHVDATDTAPASTYKGRACNKKQITGLENAIKRYSGKRIKNILGAFQAHGNPSSFHCPSARLVRMRCYENMHKLFKYVEDGDDWNIEMNCDRVALRQAGTKIPEDKDKWHRDVITGKYIEGDDSIFGGWVNLDLNNSQRFICDLGTQQRPGSAGFHREQPTGKANSVTIPPGHAIIFYQHILHAIAPSTFKSDSYRQFISFRLTKSNVPLWGGTVKEDTALEQLVPKTPGNQVIKVWMSNRHITALLWTHTVIWGLVTFKEEYIVNKKTKAGASYYLPEAPMMPHFNTYPAYTEQELNILKPVRL